MTELAANVFVFLSGIAFGAALALDARRTRKRRELLDADGALPETSPCWEGADVPPTAGIDSPGDGEGGEVSKLGKAPIINEWLTRLLRLGRPAPTPDAKQQPCDHGLTFHERKARYLSTAEIRKRWPRLFGKCPKGCGYEGIAYASWAHYHYGDW